MGQGRVQAIVPLIVIGLMLVLGAITTAPSRQVTLSQVSAQATATASPSPVIFRGAGDGVTLVIPPSGDDVSREALAYVRWQFNVLSGTPRVVFERRVSRAELPGLGIGRHPVTTVEPEPPLWVVVIHGDFDTGVYTRYQPGGQPAPLDYVLYVYDLREPFPIYTQLAPRGHGLGCIFNDPSLPDGLRACSPEVIDRPRPVRVRASEAPTLVPPGSFVPGYTEEQMAALEYGTVPVWVTATPTAPSATVTTVTATVTQIPAATPGTSITGADGMAR